MNRSIHVPPDPSKPVYVYILRRPDGTPFYVGMGRGRRIYAHERDARCKTIRCRRLGIIRKIWKSGETVGATIDSWHPTDREAGAREKELILEIGRHDLGAGPLANLTEGGDGVRDLSEEKERERSERSAATRRTPEYRKQNSERIKLWHATHPKESAETARRVVDGARSWAEKYPLLVAAAKASRAIAMRRPEVKARMAAAGRKYREENPEAEARRVEKFKATRSDPAIVEKQKKRAADGCRKPEYRQARAEFFKRWRAENPQVEIERVGKLVAFARSDENRKRVSEQTKARNRDPAYRMSHAEKMKAVWADPDYKTRVAAKIREAYQRKKNNGTQVHQSKIVSGQT